MSQSSERQWDSSSSNNSLSFAAADEPFFTRCRCAYCAEDSDDGLSSSANSLYTPASCVAGTASSTTVSASSTTLSANSTTLSAQSTVSDANSTITSAVSNTESTVTSASTPGNSTVAVASSSKSASLSHISSAYQEDNDVVSVNDDVEELVIIWKCWSPSKQHTSADKTRAIAASSGRKKRKKIVDAESCENVADAIAAAAAADNNDDDDDDDDKSMNKRRRGTVNDVCSAGNSPRTVCDVVKSSRQLLSTEKKAAAEWIGEF